MPLDEIGIDGLQNLEDVKSILKELWGYVKKLEREYEKLADEIKQLKENGREQELTKTDSYEPANQPSPEELSADHPWFNFGDPKSFQQFKKNQE